MKVETAGTHEQASLRQLEDEHRRYSERLEGLSQSTFPSADEQLEEVRLKKLKLRVKDQMAGNHPIYRFT